MTLNEVFHLIDCTIIYIYEDDDYRMFNMNNPIDKCIAEDYLLSNGNKEVKDFHYYASDTLSSFHIFVREALTHEA